MSIKYTNHLYKELCDLAEELKIKVVKGKGNFKSGACLFKNKSTIVINHNYPYESRIINLAECLLDIDFDKVHLSKKLKCFFEDLKLRNNNEK